MHNLKKSYSKRGSPALFICSRGGDGDVSRRTSKVTRRATCITAGEQRHVENVVKIIQIWIILI